jgi:hypothetical protein
MVLMLIISSRGNKIENKITLIIISINMYYYFANNLNIIKLIKMCYDAKHNLSIILLYLKVLKDIDYKNNTITFLSNYYIEVLCVIYSFIILYIFIRCSNKYNQKITSLSVHYKHKHLVLIKELEQKNKLLRILETKTGCYLNIKNIESIMIDECYNDPDCLKYEEKEWTIKKLKKKAIQMGLPDIKWGSKVAVAFVMRIKDQLVRINEIVEPLYKDGYETQEMKEEYEDKDGYETQEMKEEYEDKDGYEKQEIEDGQEMEDNEEDDEYEDKDGQEMEDNDEDEDKDGYEMEDDDEDEDEDEDKDGYEMEDDDEDSDTEWLPYKR